MSVLTDFNDKSFIITPTYIQEHLKFVSEDKHKNNLLQLAILVGRRDLVTAILDAIEDNPENQDYSFHLLRYRNRSGLGLTPLYLAAFNEKYDLFDLIVQRTPSNLLVRMQHYQEVNQASALPSLVHVCHLPLKSLYCYVNQLCNGTWTHLSSLFRIDEPLRGIGINLVERDLKSALHLAIENDCGNILNAVLEGIVHAPEAHPYLKTLPNRPDAAGKTPLDYCIDKGNRALFNRLVEHGAKTPDSITLLHKLLQASADFSEWIGEVSEGLRKEEISGFSDFEALALEQAVPHHPHTAILHQRNENFLQFNSLLKSDELPKIVKLFGGVEKLVSKITSEAPQDAAEVLGHVALLVETKLKAAGDTKKIAQLQASIESFRSGSTKSVASSSATYKKPATEKQGLLASSSSNKSKLW